MRTSVPPPTRGHGCGRRRASGRRQRSGPRKPFGLNGSQQRKTALAEAVRTARPREGASVLTPLCDHMVTKLMEDDPSPGRTGRAGNGQRLGTERSASVTDPSRRVRCNAVPQSKVADREWLALSGPPGPGAVSQAPDHPLVLAAVVAPFAPGRPRERRALRPQHLATRVSGRKRPSLALWWLRLRRAGGTDGVGMVLRYGAPWR